jgi:DNA polymerase III subunit epsilon
MTGGWIDGPMLGFDTECTGVDVETDHILSVSLVHIRHRVGNKGPREVLADTQWINPGVPIPPGATEIHGITDGYVSTVGGDPAEILEGVALVLTAVITEGTPIVGMNVPYDLTILDRNCRRHGVRTLSERMQEFNGTIAPVVDVMVLDKAVDPYRRGSGMRKLGAICPLYRVATGTLHDSEQDALATCRVAWRIGRMYRSVGRLDAYDLHLLQKQWKIEQDTSFAAYLVRNDRDPVGVDGQWPIRRPPPERISPPAPLDDRGDLVDAPLW